MWSALCSLLLLSALPAQGADEPVELAPLTPRQKAVHLLSRLSYAPTPEMLARLDRIGLDAWLDEQLCQAPISSPELRAQLDALTTIEMNPAEVREWVQASTAELSGDERKKQQRRQVFEMRNELLSSLLLRAVESDRQAEEVLADFWRNHFNVSMGKGRDILLMIPDWEHSVLRANLWGRFAEMLEDTARHPAMLHYLDQAQSRRPMDAKELARIRERTLERTGSETQAAEAVARAESNGPNENYARELLELHTLGVDHLYTQEDVVQVARALTGWTFDRRPKGRYQFRFVPALHWEGDKEFLGHPLVEARRLDPRQGEQILHILASHEITADFICSKLVRVLAADQPPKVFVRAATEAWRTSGGHLPTVVRSIVEHPAFYDPSLFRAKVKTPWEFVVSALRITNADLSRPVEVLRALTVMGQPLYYCEVPTGWPEGAEDWLDPGALAYRWEFATRLSEGKFKGARIPASFYLETLDGLPLRQWPQALEERILPGGVGERTQAALVQAVADYRAEDPGKRRRPLKQLAPQLVALLLGSPEFQLQ